MSAVGRFAPSPTSDLHLGNLRTALLAWWFARQDGGRFLIRVEDLDQQRVAAAPTVVHRQLADLASLGIDHDGEILVQSQQLQHYREQAARLEVYECFCSRKDIAAAAQAPHDGVRAYPGTCAQLSSAQRSERRLTREPALRVRAGGQQWQIQDRFAGAVSAEVDDFVLVRADGTAAYNLAVVVDDGEQGVTQVTRGADLLSSAPRQAWLAHQLGHRQPEYLHVGLVRNAAGDRLAKRRGDLTLTDLDADPRRACVRALGLISTQLGWPTIDSAAQLLTADLSGWDERRAAEEWVLEPTSNQAGRL